MLSPKGPLQSLWNFLSISCSCSVPLLLLLPPELCFVLVLQIALKFLLCGWQEGHFHGPTQKENSIHATIQCRELSLKCSGSSRTSVLSISWNKISMAVLEAIQLWFGFFFMSRSQMSLCYTWLEDPPEMSFRILL